METEIEMDKKQNVFEEIFDSIFTGRFLKSFLEWFTTILQTADASMVVLFLVVLPLVVPATPAYITYDNLLNQMNFIWQVAVLGGVTIELLGYTSAILLLKYILAWMKGEPRSEVLTVITFLSYVFYLLATVTINVKLDQQAGKSSTYIWVIALLCLLSVPSGLLSATRIIEKENQTLDSAKHKLELEEKNNAILRDRKFEEERIRMEQEFELEKQRIVSQEKIEKARVRASKSASNQLQTNRVFEASTSKSASNPSYEAPKPKTFEAVSEFIEDYLKQNNALPKTQPLMDAFGISQSAAYYAMVKYKFVHSADLVASGLLTQEDADKNALSYEKMPKGKKTQ